MTCDKNANISVRSCAIIYLATHGRQSSQESFSCTFIALIHDTHAKYPKCSCPTLWCTKMVTNCAIQHLVVQWTTGTQEYLACLLVTPDMCRTFAMHLLLQASSNKRHACTRCKTIGDFLNRLLLLQTRKKHLMSSLCFPAKYRRLVRAASLFKLWSGLQHTSGKLPYDVPKWDIGILDSIDVVADQCPWKRKLASSFVDSKSGVRAA